MRKDKGEEFIGNVLKKSLNIDSDQYGHARNGMGIGSSSSNGASMYSFLNTGKGKARMGDVQYEDDIDMVASSSQYLVEDGDQYSQHSMEDFLDFEGVDDAYEKYLELMRESVCTVNVCVCARVSKLSVVLTRHLFHHMTLLQLSVDSIRRSTPAYESVVPFEQNPYATQDNCFDLGMQLWQKGDVSKAILAFEAHVRHEPQSSDAWRMLGMCHAECDDDQSAIHALNHAIDADPQNLVALLDLGVAYTNELNNMRALVFLKSWISNHPTYAHLAHHIEQERQGNPEDTLLNYFHFHQELLDLYNSAIEQAPKDADLHTVLGVLHNISKNYDQAIEHFKSALELRPGEYSLWNKLGATLANSNSPKEAVHAYRSALQLKPNYVRSWINLGIAYANLKRHEEAVKFYLRALRYVIAVKCVHIAMDFEYIVRDILHLEISPSA